MMFNTFALIFCLVCIAGFFYLSWNGVYQVTVKNKPIASVNPLTNDAPLDEQVQLQQLPKQAIANSHWFIHIFMRPRRKKGKKCH